MREGFADYEFAEERDDILLSGGRGHAGSTLPVWKKRGAPPLGTVPIGKKRCRSPRSSSRRKDK